MEILLNAIIKAAGWSIIHSVWQGAVLYTVLLLLFISNPGLTAKSRHNLSFVILGATFLWFITTFYNEFTKWLYIGKAIQSIRVYPVGSMPVPHNVLELPVSLLNRAEQSIPLIVFIYSVGLILQIAYLLCGYYKVWQIKTKGLTDIPSELNDRFTSIIGLIGIKRKIRFKLSARVSVPMVIGYFKPMVLLPLSVLAQMNPEQLEAVIIHELSHIRRNDYLLNILKIIIETVLFFNPFVWLSAKLIDTERENACDDLVLKITGSPLSYAQTLLELEKIKSGQLVFTMAITGKKYHLLNRIKRITNMKTSNLNLKVQLFTILLIVTAVSSLAWIPAAKKKIADHFQKTANASIKTNGIQEQQKFMMDGRELSIGIRSVDTLPYLQNPVINREANFALYNNAIGTKILHFNAGWNTVSDTLPKTKGKIKIVIEDENGNKKEYNSLDELPADMRSAFLKQNQSFPSNDVYTRGLRSVNSVTFGGEPDSTIFSNSMYDVMKRLDGALVDKDGILTVVGKPVTKLILNGQPIALTAEQADAMKRIDKIEVNKGAKTQSGQRATTITVTGKDGVYTQTVPATSTVSGLTQALNIRPDPNSPVVVLGYKQSLQNQEILKQTEKLRNLPQEDRNKILEELRKDIEKKQQEDLNFRKQQEEFLKEAEKIKDLSLENRKQIYDEMSRKIDAAAKKQTESKKAQSPDSIKQK